ncbi:MAG: NHL repeat-containing protein [Chloroflexi bacterium]|nr:NHL repeat-containing protein [Chloroflexota bacterium]
MTRLMPLNRLRRVGEARAKPRARGLLVHAVIRARRFAPTGGGARVVAMVAALLLLLGGQYVLGAGLWLGVRDEALSFLRPVECIIPALCQLIYPRTFGIALISLVAAVALFHYARRPAASLLDDAGFAANPLSLDWLSLDDGKRFRWALGLTLLTTVVLAWLSLTAGAPPPLLWLLTLALAGLAFYFADRAAQRAGFLSRRELGLLAGYVLLLVALAFAFRQELTRLAAVAAGLALAAWLWRAQKLPREIIALGVIAMLGLAVYTQDLFSWRYSFIGDEYAFFEYANNIISAVNRPYLLSPRGAYDVHPVFASVVQIATMLLYGNDVYGWRMSESLAVVIGALPLYVFVRTYTRPAAALVAVTVYLFAQHLLGLSKVGYTYSQLLVPVLSSLALIALAARRGSLLGVYLSGVAAAFAFYTFAFGIPFIALPLLFFALYYFVPRERGARGFKAALANWPGLAALIVAIGLTAMPSLSDQSALQRIIGHSVVNTEVKAQNNLTAQVIPNSLYALTSFLTFQNRSHYVSGAHLDPVSSTLTLIGLGALVTLAVRRRLAFWLVASLVLVSFFVGGLAPYPYPPIARTYILIPFYAMVAAVGAERVHVPTRQRVAAVWLLAACAIPALNLYQFYSLTDRLNRQEDLALVVREFQQQPADTIFYLIVPSPYNSVAARTVLKAYNLDANRLVIVPDDNPAGSLRAIRQSANGPYEVLVTWYMPTRDRWRIAMRELWGDQADAPLLDGTDLPHFARLRVGTDSAGALTRERVDAPTPSMPWIIVPGLIPRIGGAWKVERPRDVAVGADGLIYVINGVKKVIEVFKPDGERVRTLPGDWREPYALAFNARQELLVVDSAGPAVVARLRTDGTVVARSSNDLHLSSPRGIAVAGNDDVYIADTGSGRIVRLNRDLLLPQWIATTAPLRQPTSLTFIGDRLIVADAPNLFVLSPTGQVIAQWSITPYNTVQPSRFLPGQTQIVVMTNPEAGEIDMFDLQGQVVQRIGPPNYEPFRKPMGIAALRDGRVFVAENEGNQVRVMVWGGTP